VILAGLSWIAKRWVEERSGLSFDVETKAIYGFLNFVALGFGIVVWGLERRFKMFQSAEQLSDEKMKIALHLDEAIFLSLVDEKTH
jgi:hypothetical protein